MEGLLNGSVDAIGPSVPTLTTSLLRVVRMSALAGPRAAEAFVKLSAVLHRFVREDEAREEGRVAALRDHTQQSCRHSVDRQRFR